MAIPGAGRPDLRCVVGIIIPPAAGRCSGRPCRHFARRRFAARIGLAPLLCNNPNDVASTSAAAFAIAYGFAMLVSFVSGAAWDLARNINAALVSILFGSLPILFATPRFARTEAAAATRATQPG